MNPIRDFLVVIFYQWLTLWLAAAAIVQDALSQGSRSKLEAAWSHENGLRKENVEGVLVGTKTTKPIGIFFNSTETKTPASASGRTYGLAFDWNSGKAYWLEERIGIMRSNLNGTESEVLLSDPSSWLYGIAVEPISGNLYYGDFSSGTIKICNNNATKCSSIGNCAEGFVFDFAVHPSKGLLLWSIRDKHVVRANLDGSNATTLKLSSVRGLEVDELEDRLYWGSLAGIGSCDLNLGDVRLLSSVQRFVQDVAIVDKNFYYTTNDTKDLWVISKLGSVSSLVKQLTNYPYWNIASFGQRVSSKLPNPCENSECGHLCVLTSASSYRCVCADDEELNSDGKTCRFTSAVEEPIEIRNLMQLRMDAAGLEDPV